MRVNAYCTVKVIQRTKLGVWDKTYVMASNYCHESFCSEGVMGKIPKSDRIWCNI